MSILVDADACPKVIKEILYRVAERLSIQVLFVANQPFAVPRSKFIQFKQVHKGFDVADDAIVEMAKENDLVITADIPLAAKAIEKGAFALNPRGQFYTKDNIGAILTMRNFKEELRGAGEMLRGPSTLHKRDQQAFANALDTFLAKLGPRV